MIIDRKRIIFLFIALFFFLYCFQGSPVHALSPKEFGHLHGMTETELRGYIRSQKEKLHMTQEKMEQGEIQKRIGIAYHNLSVLGDKEVTPMAVKHLREARSLLPEDVEILAYQGSTRGLEGRDAWFPLARISHARAGIAILDRAVQMDPSHSMVRTLRIYSSLALPSFFGRENIAKKDLEYLMHTFETDNSILSPTLAADLYVKLASLYRKENDLNSAMRFWNRARVLAPQSDAGREAEKFMGIYEDGNEK